MIKEKIYIKELYELKHKNDSTLHNGYDYENNLFKKLLSNVMFGNDMLKEFIMKLQVNVVWMIDSTLLIRNWWNYTVDKYCDNHNN